MQIYNIQLLPSVNILKTCNILMNNLIKISEVTKQFTCDQLQLIAKVSES